MCLLSLKSFANAEVYACSETGALIAYPSLIPNANHGELWGREWKGTGAGGVFEEGGAVWPEGVGLGDAGGVAVGEISSVLRGGGLVLENGVEVRFGSVSLLGGGAGDLAGL